MLVRAKAKINVKCRPAGTLSSDILYAAPRFGFVFAPTRDERTAIRGGVGIFYDKIPLNVAVFREIPAQTITQFAPDGISIVQPCRLPRSDRLWRCQPTKAREKGASTIIVGCDYHPGFQQIAFVDADTGELQER